MNQSLINKTLLASAISMSMASTYAVAAPAEMPVTNMVFGPEFYNAGGFFNTAGNVGPFNPLTDLVLVPNAGRALAPDFDPLTASGNIYSFDNFNGFPWEGEQQTPYFTNADSWAFVYDHANSDCTAPTGVIPGKDTGACSDQGSYDFDEIIQGMTDEQIAIGMFFSWNGSNGISVLEIFNCDVNDNCVGTGIPMANGPFAGAKAIFNAGLTCGNADFKTTGKDTPVGLDIATDVLGFDDTDPKASNCVNPTSAPPKVNPPGLKVDSVVSPTVGGGTAVINGTVIDYTPAGGYEGTDKFVITISDDTGQSSEMIYAIQVGGQLQNNFSMLDKSGAVFGGSNDVDIGWDEVSFNANTVALDAATGSFSIPTDTNFEIMTIGSPEPFFNFNWRAHHVRIFKNTTAAAITYSMDVTCLAADYDTQPAGIVDCNRPLAEQGANTRYITMTLEPGEVGGHILFDWGKDNPATECGQQNCNIDVVNKWSAGQWNKHGGVAPINTIWIGPAGVPPATVENSGEGNQANWVLVSGDVNGDGINSSPMVDGAFVGSSANFNYKPDKVGTALPPHTGEIDDVEVDGFSFSLWTLFAGLFSMVSLRRYADKK